MKHGTRGWLAMAAGIALFDLHAAVTGRETLSLAFSRAIRHPRRRPWVVGAYAYITVHLFSLLPSRIDPLRSSRSPGP